MSDAEPTPVERGYADGYLDGFEAGARAATEGLQLPGQHRPRFEIVVLAKVTVVRDHEKGRDFAFLLEDQARAALDSSFRQGLGHEFESRPIGFYDNI